MRLQIGRDKGFDEWTDKELGRYRERRVDKQRTYSDRHRDKQTDGRIN